MFSSLTALNSHIQLSHFLLHKHVCFSLTLSVVVCGFDATDVNTRLDKSLFTTYLNYRHQHLLLLICLHHILSYVSDIWGDVRCQYVLVVALDSDLCSSYQQGDISLVILLSGVSYPCKGFVIGGECICKTPVL